MPEPGFVERGQLLVPEDGYASVNPAYRGPRAATSDAFDRSTRYEIAFWQLAHTRGASEFHLE